MKAQEICIAFREIADRIRGIFDRVIEAIKRIFGGQPGGKHSESVPKVGADPRRKQRRKRRYPRHQEQPARYSRRPAVISPQGEVMASVYELRCPICERKVKRSESYCRECGNHLVVESGVE